MESNEVEYCTDLTFKQLRDLCKQYDREQGSYRESEYEGRAVLRFIVSKMLGASQWSEEVSSVMETYNES